MSFSPPPLPHSAAFDAHSANTTLLPLSGSDAGDVGIEAVGDRSKRGLKDFVGPGVVGAGVTGTTSGAGSIVATASFTIADPRTPTAELSLSLPNWVSARDIGSGVGTGMLGLNPPSKHIQMVAWNVPDGIGS